MRTALLALVALALAPAPAAALPAAEVVLYWAPPDAPAALRARARATATELGVGFVDRSPAAPPAADDSARIAAAVAAYEALRFDEAVQLLDAAAVELDRSGAAGLDVARLAELFLYRGLAQIQLGEATRAWDDLLLAARIDPTRVLDPARFPPRAIEQLERARAEVAAAPRGALLVVAQPGCVISIDGAIAGDGRADLAHGVHWVSAACRGHLPWGRRVVVDRTAVQVIATATAVAPPGDDDALIQARALGVAVVTEVIVVGDALQLRRRRADGRELARAAAMAEPDALAGALRRLLAPATTTTRWYRSRWAWAAAGAAVAAAVLVPIALSDGGDGERVLRPSGIPPWN